MSSTSEPVTLRQSLAFALSSRRTAAVTLLSFSSGLPLGLIWIAVPDWMRSVGVDIRWVGLMTLAHAPWTFKMLWSPLMDRYPLPWLGRRRGWILVCQLALTVTTLLLAGAGGLAGAPWVILSLCLAMAIAAASQDIVIDAYAVDVLRPEEQGIAVGARTASYRVAMMLAGGWAITMLTWVSWGVLATVLALLYLPMIAITFWSPEPREPASTPASLREAVWLPFVGFLRQHRALEILAFVLFYKLADNLAEALLRPFLVDAGYSNLDRGLGLATVGFLLTLVGTLAGGVLSGWWGLGHSLWLFGFLQIFSNVGYILVARSEPDLLLMYGAMGFESVTKGMGMGAFGVLLLRMTQKRFSATQYALFSSLFALPRLAAGPITGFVVHAVGWVPFFAFTMVMGIPGMVLLARFVPLGLRDPQFVVEPPRPGPALGRPALVGRALAGGLIGAGVVWLTVALLKASEAFAAEPGGSFELVAELRAIAWPADLGSGLVLAGVLVCGVVCGLIAAAVAAARRGGFDGT